MLFPRNSRIDANTADEHGDSHQPDQLLHLGVPPISSGLLNLHIIRDGDLRSTKRCR